MGLTSQSVGIKSIDSGLIIKKRNKEDKIIAAQIIRDPEKTLGTDEANNAFIYGISRVSR